MTNTTPGLEAHAAALSGIKNWGTEAAKARCDAEGMYMRSEWQPESFEMKVTDEAIDHLKAAVRAFGNDNDSRALCDIENAIFRLLDSRDVEKIVIEAVRSHMRRNCFVEAL